MIWRKKSLIVAGEIWEVFAALTHKQELVTISSETPDLFALF